jgi:WD40 repeat protein
LDSRLLEGHSAPVTAILFLLDGKTLVSGSADKSVKLWNSRTGKLERTLTTHTTEIISISLSPDGKTLATSDNQETRLWNTKTWQLERTIREIKHGAIFWPDGTILAEIDDAGDIKLWNAETGELKRTLKTPASALKKQETDRRGYESEFSFAWNLPIGLSHDGKVAAGLWDWGCRLTFWDARSGEIKKNVDYNNGAYVAISPDSKLLAVSGLEEVKLWDAQTGEEHTKYLSLGTLPFIRFDMIGVERIVFSPDGKTLAGVTYLAVFLWNMETREPKRILTAGPDIFMFTCPAFSPDCKTLAVGRKDGKIQIADLSK